MGMSFEVKVGADAFNFFNLITKTNCAECCFFFSIIGKAFIGSAAHLLISVRFFLNLSVATTNRITERRCVTGSMKVVSMVFNNQWIR